MHHEDFTKLADDVEAELLHGATSVAILGATPQRYGCWHG
jgi:hypothetical protein